MSIVNRLNLANVKIVKIVELYNFSEILCLFTIMVVNFDFLLTNLLTYLSFATTTL
jgi:hypothetical protein